jgi:hypothetical protein
MKRISWLLGLLLLLAGAAPAPAAEARLRLLIPAYFYPEGAGLKDWDRLIASPARADLVVIVNPASGPGTKADPNYVKVVGRAVKAKLPLIGYVTTSYGKRTLDQVKTDVDRYVRFYPGIGGIFFDEQASGADKVDYQAALYTYVRKRRGLRLVFTNPGTVCDEGYLTRPAADVACLFEGPKGLDAYTPPKWAKKVGAAHIAVVNYRIERALDMRKYVRGAAAKNVGYLYVTDAAGSNPYGRLPRYWKEELAALQDVNKRPRRR